MTLEEQRRQQQLLKRMFRLWEELRAQPLRCPSCGAALRVVSLNFRPNMTDAFRVRGLCDGRCGWSRLQEPKADDD